MPDGASGCLCKNEFNQPIGMTQMTQDNKLSRNHGSEQLGWQLGLHIVAVQGLEAGSWDSMGSGLMWRRMHWNLVAACAEDPCRFVHDDERSEHILVLASRWIFMCLSFDVLADRDMKDSDATASPGVVWSGGGAAWVNGAD